MGATSTRTQDTPITRDDIAAKLREIEGDARDHAESAQSTLTVIAAVLAGLLLLIAFVLGRRAGRKRSTIVEIRRV